MSVVQRLEGSLSALPPKEARLLHLLLIAEGRCLTREALSSAIWGNFLPGSRRLDMLASSLRAKLSYSQDLARYSLTAIRNEGYSLLLKPVDNL